MGISNNMMQKIEENFEELNPEFDEKQKKEKKVIKSKFYLNIDKIKLVWVLEIILNFLFQDVEKSITLIKKVNDKLIYNGNLKIILNTDKKLSEKQ